MRVFITGGSGYIGQAVVEALVAEGHDVEALVRQEADASVVSDIGAKPRRGDLGALDVLRAAGEHADAVIHLAPSDPDTDLAASAALQERLGGGPFVFTGGAWVYGDTDGIVNEDAPLAPPPIVGWRVENTYLGVGESDVTMRQVAEAASRAAGAGGLTRSLSLGDAQQVWGPLADALALDQQFTARRARDELGWVPREAGVIEYLADSAVAP